MIKSFEQIECCPTLNFELNNNFSVVFLRVPNGHIEEIEKYSPDDILYQNENENIIIDQKLTYYSEKRGSLQLNVKTNLKDKLIINEDTQLFSLFVISIGFKFSDVINKKLVIRTNKICNKIHATESTTNLKLIIIFLIMLLLVALLVIVL